MALRPEVQRWLNKNVPGWRTSPDKSYYISQARAALGIKKPQPASPATPAPPTTAAAPTPPAPTGYEALSGNDRDWVDELTILFRDNGLESLAGRLTGLVQGGYAGPALTLALQETDEYKQRFAANEARKRAGLRVLSPAEYIDTESQYRKLMQAAGLPQGFYDSQDDFRQLLERDVSPTEVQGRVGAYVQAARNTDSAYRKMIADTFGVGLTDGDIAAYMMDPQRALPVIEKQVNSFGVADAARRQGLSYSAERANQLTEAGVTADQANQSYGQIAEMTSAFGRAGDAFGLEYDQDEAEDEGLLGLASAKRKRERVEQTFTGYNSGTSRTSRGALRGDDSGSY